MTFAVFYCPLGCRPAFDPGSRLHPSSSTNTSTSRPVIHSRSWRECVDSLDRWSSYSTRRFIAEEAIEIEASLRFIIIIYQPKHITRCTNIILDGKRFTSNNAPHTAKTLRKPLLTTRQRMEILIHWRKLVGVDNLLTIFINTGKAHIGPTDVESLVVLIRRSIG